MKYIYKYLEVGSAIILGISLGLYLTYTYPHFYIANSDGIDAIGVQGVFRMSGVK